MKPAPLLAALPLLAVAATPLVAQVTVVNTVTHTGPFAGGVAFDPVTNELVVVDSNSDSATYYDRVTGVQTNSFPIAATITVVGAHVDASTGNLWIVGENEIAYQLDRSGATLSSFSVAPTITDASAITMDPATGTLWVSNDSSNVVAEFTRTGVATGAQFTPAGSTDGDGLTYDPYSRTFLLGEDSLNQIRVVDRTGVLVTVFAMAPLGISPEGLAIDTTTGRVFVANGLVAPIAVFELAGVIQAPPANAVVRYGSSCNGPIIAASDAVDDDGLTVSGTAIGYRGALPAGSAALIVIGLSQQSVPVSVLLPSNCTAYALPEVTTLIGLTNSNRRLGFLLPVPVGAQGFQANFWGADIDVATLSVPSASQGLQITVQ